MNNVAGLAAFMLLCILVATPASGIESTPDKSEPGWLYEIRAGVLAHDVDRLWSGFQEESGVDFNAEVIFRHPSFPLLLGTVRPNSGLSINNRGDTSKVYAGLLWELEMKSGMFLSLGIGVAVHDGELETNQEDKKRLGSRVLFRIPIEVGYALNRHHRVSIAFDHVSNAHLASPNQGLDTLGLRYGYRF
jgi:lipid A 3-O-deacylase